MIAIEPSAAALVFYGVARCLPGKGLAEKLRRRTGLRIVTEGQVNTALRSLAFVRAAAVCPLAWRARLCDHGMCAADVTPLGVTNPMFRCIRVARREA